MGDVAMIVPVVVALAHQYPEVRITILSRPFASSFFEKLAPNVEFIPANLNKDYQGISGLNALYSLLKKKKFTAVADLHDVLRTKYLRGRFFLSRVNTAHIDKHRKLRHQLLRYGAGEGVIKNGEILSEEEKHQRQLPTVFNNYADVFAKLGFPVTLSQSAIDILNCEKDTGSNSQYLNTQPADFLKKSADQVWIGIAPFAAHRGKILPSATIRSLIERLSERDNTTIMLFSGKGKEREEVKKWCKQYDKCVDASSEAKSLKAELAIMQQLNVMVSMDSANQHLASLVATPVVSIWGATHPAAGFMGWNQSSENIVGLPLACRPCSIYGNKPCRFGDYACLSGITADDILAKIDRYV